MASTLLAVDDSVTMRKVLEITFAGTDLKVVTADSPDAALAKLKSDKPDLVIADVTLEPKNGYELCKAVKQASPGTQVLVLSSKQTPYDAAKGADAKADDHMDKPFDTQQMIDKVRKMLQSKGTGAVAAAPTAAPAAAFAAPAGPHTSPTQPAQPAVNPLGRTQPQTSAGAPPQRAKTLIYSPAAGTPAIPAPTAKPVPASKPESTPVTGVPLQPRIVPAPAPSAPAAAPAPVAAVAAQVNGQMASKLEGLGLTPAQVDAVLALSRDVVERVVWEVVPVLAETIIKEEIARLVK